MGVGTAIGVIGGTAAAGIGGAAISSSAAGHAADTQANAANHAADLQHQDAQDALAFQKSQYGDSQKNLAPWLKAGSGAITTLSDLLKNGGFPNWTDTFHAPTDVTEQNDPGYKFRLQQGQQMLENSAAARGGALTTGAEKNLIDYGQNAASSEYGNVYNRAFNEYATRYNQFQQNQNNTFNRYASIAGVGQQAANSLNSSGQAAANNVGNINLTSGAQIGQQYNNAAAARASGYVGSANAYSGALGNISGSVGQYLTLQQLLNGSQIPVASQGTMANLGSSLGMP